MGSGKTSTGKELAKLLKLNFWDMDQWIEEKNKKSISNIFTEKGEEFFRLEETEAIDWLKNKESLIISTGGGVWVNQENRKKLLKLGWCLWLKVSPEKVLERIGLNLSQRPVLAQSKNPLIEIKNILSIRNPIYSLAHASIATDGKMPKDIALEIINSLQKDHPFDLSFL